MTTRPSHPPTLLTHVRRALGSEAKVARGDAILVAVSGGPDSMALLHALAWLRSKVGHSLVAHGVDHGLRAGAEAELDAAGRFAASLDVPFARTRVRLCPGGNLQARARDARYDALRRAAGAAGARWIATAHHADDRAETVLLRVLRGSRPAGLAVLPAVSGALLRPMIRARRSDVLAHLARHCIPHVLDPSNEDPRFVRTRVRREVLPLLEQLNPGVVAHLCALADGLRRDHGEAYIPAFVKALHPPLEPEHHT